MAICALPAALRGRREHLCGALQGLALAGGGLVGWLRPQWFENARGYRSAGTLAEAGSRGSETGGQPHDEDPAGAPSERNGG